MSRVGHSRLTASALGAQLLSRFHGRMSDGALYHVQSVGRGLSAWCLLLQALRPQ
jgi:hypothetical protein